MIQRFSIMVFDWINRKIATVKEIGAYLMKVGMRLEPHTAYEGNDKSDLGCKAISGSQHHRQFRDFHFIILHATYYFRQNHI